jgi:hypothetical protein
VTTRGAVTRADRKAIVDFFDTALTFFNNGGHNGVTVSDGEGLRR